MPKAESQAAAQESPTVAVVPEGESTAVIANGAKLVGESFIPGASLLLDGEVTKGLVHTAVGFGARAMLGAWGPLGVLVVAANSYSKSVTDRHLHEHLVGVAQSTRIQRVPPSESASTSPAPS